MCVTVKSCLHLTAQIHQKLQIPSFSHELTGILIIKIRTLSIYFAPYLIKTNSLEHCNQSPPLLYRYNNGGTAKEFKSWVSEMRLKLSWAAAQPVLLTTPVPRRLLGWRVYIYQLHMTFQTDFPDSVDNKDSLIYKISVISELKDWKRQNIFNVIAFQQKLRESGI